jgi:hypothetical protein
MRGRRRGGRRAAASERTAPRRHITRLAATRARVGERRQPKEHATGEKANMRIGIVGVIYLFIGVFVAASQEYLERLGQLKGIVTALLGILLWPLLLLGFDFRVE